MSAPVSTPPGFRLEPMHALLLTMLLGGVVLRFWQLEFPKHLTFDEHHFVENARNYLRGKPDWNDHPPLGKLFQAFSIKSLGDDSFAFRLPSAICGTLNLVFAGLLARSVFRSTSAGLLAAAFVACDGFLIAYSRTALLDGMLTTFTLLALWLMTLRGVVPVLLSGVAIGLGMSMKMSAITLLGALFALAFLRALERQPRFAKAFKQATLFGRPLRTSWGVILAALPALGIAVFTYLAVWMYGLSITGQDGTLSGAVNATSKMMAHHAKLTDWTHPLLSRFWTWPLPTTPILLRHDHDGLGMVRGMTMMGNPLLWWSVAAAVLALPFFRALRQRQQMEKFWLLLAFVAYISPWIVSNRDSYIYHYLPPYSVGIVLVAGLAAEYRKHVSRTQVTMVVCAVAIVSAFYAPVWAQLPMSEDAFNARPFTRPLK